MRICRRIFVVLQGGGWRNTLRIPTDDNAAGQQKDKANAQVIVEQLLIIHSYCSAKRVTVRSQQGYEQ